MQRICKRCGKNYETDKKYSYYCPSCAKKAKEENVVKQRICKDCGASFAGGPRAFYCPNCRKARERERAGRYRRNGYARKLGSTDICEVCGSEYVVNSGLQRYCPNCAEAAVKAADRPAGVQWMQDNKESFYPQRNARRKVIRFCVICGAEINSKTNTVTCDNPECKKERRRQQLRGETKMPYTSLCSAVEYAFKKLKHNEVLFDGLDYWTAPDLMLEAPSREVSETYTVDNRGNIYIAGDKKPLYWIATNDDTQWGTQLAYHRHYAGLTQKQLAAESGVHINIIGRIERGEAKSANISLKSAVALAKVLGVHAEDLLDESPT